ncbi:hypothetical protein AAMO2058_001389100 [Amorphochlora amoebiformis]
MFANRNFQKWMLGHSLFRSVCIVLRFALESAQGPFIYLAAVVESVSHSWCNNLVYVYLYCRDNDFVPRLRQQDIFAILIFPLIILSAISGFLQVVDDWAHDFLVSTISVYVATLCLVIIYFVGKKARKSSRIQLGKSDKLSVLFMVTVCASSGIVAIIAVMRYFRRALENNGVYEPIYELLMFYFTTFLLTSIIWEFLDLVPMRNRESLQLLLVSAQYFQEFTVGLIFLEEGLNPRFAGLVSLVVMYDFLTESGIFYERYFIWFKKIQTFKSKAIYMAKKYYFVKIKAFSEHFSTPALFITVLMEEILHKTYPRTILTDSNEKRTDLLGVYAILICAEIITSHVSARSFDSRMEKIRDDAFSENTRNTRVDTNTSPRNIRLVSEVKHDSKHNRMPSLALSPSGTGHVSKAISFGTGHVSKAISFSPRRVKTWLDTERPAPKILKKVSEDSVTEPSVRVVINSLKTGKIPSSPRMSLVPTPEHKGSCTTESLSNSIFTSTNIHITGPEASNPIYGASFPQRSSTNFSVYKTSENKTSNPPAVTHSSVTRVLTHSPLSPGVTDFPVTPGDTGSPVPLGSTRAPVTGLTLLRTEDQNVSPGSGRVRSPSYAVKHPILDQTTSISMAEYISRNVTHRPIIVFGFMWSAAVAASYFAPDSWYEI